MRKVWLSSFILISILLFTVGCSDNNEDSAEKEGSDDKPKESETATDEEKNGSGSKPEMPEPDLEDVPDVVAEVNGEEISRVEFKSNYVGQFQRAVMQAQMTGQEIDQSKLKKQITNALVGQELVVQEAEKNGFEASEKAVNKELDTIVEQNKLESQEEYFTALKEQDMTKEDIISQIKKQLKVDKLIKEETGDVDPTEKELKEVYNNYTKQLEERNKESDKETDVPTFEDMKSDLIKQVKKNKETQAYQKIIKDLEKDADITKNI